MPSVRSHPPPPCPFDVCEATTVLAWVAQVCHAFEAQPVPFEAMLTR